MINCRLEMPHTAMTHDMCRTEVCAVCNNLNGEKAKRVIKSEEEAVLKELVPGYSSLHSFFPNGICLTDIFLLRKKLRGENVKILLPDQYIKVNISRVTRSSVAAEKVNPCSCHICNLAKLNGLAFKLWKKNIKQPEASFICPRCWMVWTERK